MNSSNSGPRERSASHSRRGVTAVEVVIVVAVIGLLLSLLWPWIVSVRELARRSSCQSNLRLLGTALSSYHGVHGRLPVAGVWTTRQLDSLALNHSRRVDLYTQSNWALSLLPFAGEDKLAAQLHSDLLIAAPENEAIRNSRPPIMKCPSDTFNTEGNPYRLTPDSSTSITFARGNYAINGGSHCPKDGSGTTSLRTGDEAHLVMDRSTREFRYWGNGIAGFNVSFSLDDFENGTGSLVAIEEVRAGVHAIDPRGVWALGQIGGSVTWAHGVNGDAYGPNNPHPKSDDLLDGDLINQTIGAEQLSNLGMPCVNYINFNSQAAARSMHPGGINLLMVDGAARFVSDAIDPGLWHVMHSRETPRTLLKGDLDALIAESMIAREKPSSDRAAAAPDHEVGPSSVNSLGMEFVLIPAGEFEMGMPDRGNDYDLPVEVPQHTVRLSKSYYLGIHEVTRSQYSQVMGTTSADGRADSTEEAGAGSFPMVQVTWNDAEEFCRRLSAMTAEKSAGRRYRLPTEAEWEYACRAGSRTPYQWSTSRRLSDDSGDAAGIAPPLPLCPVGSYPPNPFGLYDLRGNAWEWCADWFDRGYYARSPKTDPQGPHLGYLKVIRGSDWTFIGEGCKLSYAVLPSWKSNPFVGFRVVCDIGPNN